MPDADSPKPKRPAATESRAEMLARRARKARAKIIADHRAARVAGRRVDDGERPPSD